jgi:50S ribosomal protein L16 3-hydroxylase
MKVLGGISAEEFITTYWNKRPLIVKNAVDSTLDIASFDDFVELSLDPDFETRIVYQSGGEYPWQAKLGPFKKKEFSRKALWTLMCHNLELYNSDLFKIKNELCFMPEWHFDDVMSTTSVKGASVGAHIDDYSVFILQGEGKRKCLLQENPKHDYIPNLDIRLLKEFNPNIEVELSPGDMIYIPPNVAHHGITLEDSVSYSFGFKSIRYKDVLDAFATEMMALIDENSFHDYQPPLQKDLLLLEEYVVDKVFDEVKTLLFNREQFRRSLLKHLSRPKNSEELGDTDHTDEEILNLIKEKFPLRKDIWSKLVSQNLDSNKYLISINSNLLEVDSKTYEVLRRWFTIESHLDRMLTQSEIEHIPLMEVLLVLVRNGVFFFAAENEDEDEVEDEVI